MHRPIPIRWGVGFPEGWGMGILPAGPKPRAAMLGSNLERLAPTCWEGSLTFDVGDIGTRI